MPSKTPPYHLDPHEAIRNPEGLPALFQRGMYDVIMREWDDAHVAHPATEPPHRNPTYDQFIRAFNIIAKGLTDSHRLKFGTLILSGGVGDKREDEVKRLTDTKKKIKWIARWAESLRRQFPDRVARSWWDYQDKARPGEVTRG